MTSEQIKQLEKLLGQVFGFTSFRPGQLEIIETIKIIIRINKTQTCEPYAHFL